jgi:hypothetical protein
VVIVIPPWIYLAVAVWAAVIGALGLGGSGAPPWLLIGALGERVAPAIGEKQIVGLAALVDVPFSPFVLGLAIKADSLELALKHGHNVDMLLGFQCHGYSSIT